MNSVFFNISVSAKEISQDASVIGGYVLSSLLKKRTIYKNVDIFTEGSGILLGQKVSNKFYHHPILTYFRRFGTARFKNNGNQIEFIGDRNSINGYETISISLNEANYGVLIDTLNTSNTYYEKTLRVIRSIRFASELQLTEQISFYSIFEQRELLRMFSIEVIITDFNKIILSHKPSEGLSLLDETGLLSKFLPEITWLKEFEEKEGSYHKNNFFHTLEVVENVSEESNSLWLRWAALGHDIGKSITKKYIYGPGWTFYAHEYIGARLLPYIFQRLKFPMSYTLKYVQKIVQYSSRTIDLVSYEATDSSLRRVLFDVGVDIEDLLLFCKADITTKNFEKKLRYINHFLLVEKKLKNFEIKDSRRKCTIPISGNKIMQYLQLQPSPQVGIIKKAIKEAILDGKLANDFTDVNSKLGFAVELKGGGLG